MEYNGNFYGTEFKQIEESQDQGKICLIEIELEGSQNVQKKRGHWNFIYIFPPSVEDLVTRLVFYVFICQF